MCQADKARVFMRYRSRLEGKIFINLFSMVFNFFSIFFFFRCINQEVA